MTLYNCFPHTPRQFIANSFKHTAKLEESHSEPQPTHNLEATSHILLDSVTSIHPLSTQKSPLISGCISQQMAVTCAPLPKDSAGLSLPGVHYSFNF